MRGAIDYLAQAKWTIVYSAVYAAAWAPAVAMGWLDVLPWWLYGVLLVALLALTLAGMSLSAFTDRLNEANGAYQKLVRDVQESRLQEGRSLRALEREQELLKEEMPT